MGLPKIKNASASEETDDNITASIGLKRKRGRTSMERIVNRALRGKKSVVEFNPKGVPFGKAAAEMASYIGVIVRTTVPIIVESWPKVEKDLKNEIWKSVEMAFVLAPRCRKMVLSSAANKWRQFKSELTTKYVLPYKDQPDALKDPPEEYDFIKQQDWEQFVKSRLTTDFQKLHMEQKERRGKLQNAHRMSRKGYAGLEAELKKTMNEDELDLAVLWKKGREDKNGNISHETVGEQAAEMDTLMNNEGDISNSNSRSSDDVRSMGLGTPEHSSRVRSAGECLMPNVSPPQLERESVLDEVRKMIEQQRLWFEAKISLLEAKISGDCPATSITLPTPLLAKPSKKGRCSGKTNVEDNEIDSEAFSFVGRREFMKGKSCKLAVGSINNVVSHGTIIEMDVANHKVHGVPLGEGNIRVAIDNALDEQALLPIPVTGELATVGQAVGSHVAWPKHLVKLMNEEERGNSSIKPRDLPNQDVILPKSLKLLYRYAERAMTDGEPISVFMEEAIFGIAKTLNIFKEDVMQFMEMKEIPPRCITVYMRHLYDMLKQSNMANMVGLMDPSSISVGEGNSDHRSQVLATRLQQGSADQILLVPYNSGYHWMLTIISEDKEVCYFMDPLQRYFMDPLRRSMREEEWKYVVNNGIRQFNIETGRGFRKQPLWKVLMGPKQPSNMECGYYVMRYMKEIIEGHDLSFATKWDGRKLNAYTQTELDEVRCEWTDFVSNYV
ncbi:putative Ulp1 protease family catalytic domain, putative transposase, Ptta/En/Spm, plant [Rosa chinensis]|uniref:Putative Ulp1 protease family catalytic domain, putative transposase, Ptta/En/Spm, plant n=1 Tax=Rosa chinensis TaxID=74649 RepID=A0A2P6RQ71_ROSCH|nr:uncharacterized protein LOC112190477 [Rosa chinensis]PRQ48579.1 putative Ulp1 protease family catalytic domain, putative transposase, Ptta/En/Spm, plant [Rosa chinensis]